MRTLTVAALCLVVFPAAALAKGPSEATIEGPGLAMPLKIDGSGSWDEGGPFPALIEETAFFSAAWGGDHALLRAKPAGHLGPRYRVTYLLPGPAGRVDRIRQDLYPHARGGPLAFMPPGQPFFDTSRTRGGWFRGSPRLRNVLVAAGVPAPSPSRSPAAGRDDDHGVAPGLWALVAMLALAGVAAFALGRRARPASA